MSVLDNLNRIKSCKDDIKQALTDRGVDMTNVAFTEYATKINEIPSGGGDYLDMRANMSTYYSTAEEVPSLAFAQISTLTSVNLPNCIYMGYNAFSLCSKLTTVNIPNCKDIREWAFDRCSSLSSIDLPKCSIVGSSAFRLCINLTSVNLPMCEKLSDYAFVSCSSLSSIDLPNCSALGYQAFGYCSSLSSIDLPKCSTVSGQAFYECKKLSTVNLPKCIYTSPSVFFRCTSLQSVYLPHITRLEASMFEQCSSLQSVYSPVVWAIYSFAFRNAWSLTELDLRSTYSCDLFNSNAFYSTQIASGIGSIYVHNTVLSKFQNATNWTYFSDRFVGVGDPDKPLLSFDSGRVYGDTYCIYSNFKTFLGINSSSITSVDLPNVSQIVFTSYLFQNCTNLTTVNLPMCGYLSDYAFSNCTNLTTVNLPMCSYLSGTIFKGCSGITLYIGTSLSTVCYLKAALNNVSPDRYTMKSIFVPMSLVDAYKSAPYWSNYASVIYGI